MQIKDEEDFVAGKDEYALSVLASQENIKILQDSKLADSSTLAIIQTGETSGTLPRSLRDMAERLEFQAQQSLDRMAVLLPLACYLPAVGLIGMQIFRILSPILQAYQELMH
jgi:type II secretory pathway component PulF